MMNQKVSCATVVLYVFANFFAFVYVIAAVDLDKHKGVGLALAVIGANIVYWAYYRRITAFIGSLCEKFKNWRKKQQEERALLASYEEIFEQEKKEQEKQELESNANDADAKRQG